MSSRRTWLALLFFALACPEPVVAEDKFFLVMFASQQCPKDPDYAHTFATFVKQTDGKTCDVQTISWLPVKMPVRLRALLPETGRNYELHETLKIVLESRQRVSLWGPYEIQPELYAKAVKKIGALNGGGIRYKAFDGLYRNEDVTNCIHAVSSITESSRLRALVPGWGDSASYFVLNKLMPWIVDPITTHDQIVDELKLTAYPIAYRKVFDRHLLPPATGLRLILHDAFPQPTYGPPALRARSGR